MSLRRRCKNLHQCLSTSTYNSTWKVNLPITNLHLYWQNVKHCIMHLLMAHFRGNFVSGPIMVLSLKPHWDNIRIYCSYVFVHFPPVLRKKKKFVLRVFVLFFFLLSILNHICVIRFIGGFSVMEICVIFNAAFIM